MLNFGRWRAVCVPDVKKEVLYSNIKYQNLTSKERLNILCSLLDSMRYEIYTRNGVDILIYDLLYEDFIHENGNDACNLIIFWENVVEALHKGD